MNPTINQIYRAAIVHSILRGSYFRTKIGKVSLMEGMTAALRGVIL